MINVHVNKSREKYSPVQDRECYRYICFSYRTERMRWIEAFTPQNQGDSDDKIYESWGK